MILHDPNVEETKIISDNCDTSCKWTKYLYFLNHTKLFSYLLNHTISVVHRVMYARSKCTLSVPLVLFTLWFLRIPKKIKNKGKVLINHIFNLKKCLCFLVSV